MRKTVGIIGGMGPIATYDLFKKIIEKTDAKTDQEHIHICIDCNTNIPDRTQAILEEGENPVPEIVKSGVRLQAIGADVLVMPCNTAHYFYDKITPFLDIPLLNMLKETAAEIKRRQIRKVGLLATDGTIKSGVYHKALTDEGIDVVIPSPIKQVSIMDVIYHGVKAANRNIDLGEFYGALDELYDKGAEVLILGCTELPIAFEVFHIDRPAIDPTAILAEAVIRFINMPLLKSAV
jgi:aspartate racemase